MNLLRNPYRKLEKALGYRFRKKKHLEEALTHRSWRYEAPTSNTVDNQRLEFLGDAALGAVAAEWLVAHRPDWREGPLTKVRSRLTNAAALARVARRLELGDFLRLGRGEEQSGGRDKEALLADALEAVLGALWTDGGPGPVRNMFANWFADEIAEAVEAGGDDNPKGDLQERMQRERKESPRYEVVEESGPPHARHFKVAVFRGEEKLGEGEGASKRTAEMVAARNALRNGISGAEE